MHARIQSSNITSVETVFCLFGKESIRSQNISVWVEWQTTAATDKHWQCVGKRLIDDREATIIVLSIPKLEHSAQTQQLANSSEKADQKY